MSQSLDAFTPEYWADRIQDYLKRNLISQYITSYVLKKHLNNGDKIHQPYIDVGDPQDYTKNTGYATEADIETTDEYLEVNTFSILPMYIDKQDKIQNKYKTANEAIDKGSYKLKKKLDAAVFAEYDNADDNFDYGDMAGTSGLPIPSNKDNVSEIIAKAKAMLAAKDVEPDKPWFLCVDPNTMADIEEYVPQVGFQSADKVIRDGLMEGYKGRFKGLQLYSSNNLTWTGKWTPADNPTTGATISINGVTITFITTAIAAGQIKIGANTAETLDRLVAAINGTGTGDGTDYFEFTAANRRRLYGCAATDGTTYLGIEFVGQSVVNPLTSVAADAWSIPTTHCLMGQVGSIDQVIQEMVNVEVINNPISPVTGNQRLGKSYVPNSLSGIKTFADGAARFLDLQIENG